MIVEKEEAATIEDDAGIVLVVSSNGGRGQYHT